MNPVKATQKHKEKLRHQIFNKSEEPVTFQQGGKISTAVKTAEAKINKQREKSIDHQRANINSTTSNYKPATNFKGE